ncbi:MAG: hypothetical protein HQL87_09525 [Magnetococcales bacterium]|nr:hypothetical protein [Magnetococcales bacterium]
MDLGQAKDYTAITIIKRFREKRPVEYQLQHLERMKGIPYPDQVARVAEIIKSPKLTGYRIFLIVDQTGVGRPVMDMLRASRLGIPIIAIMIHGGDAVGQEGQEYRVPKRDLVGVLQVLFQNKRFQVIRTIPNAELLIQELMNFKVKINLATAHDSYEALREGDHDDLVLSAAIACWWGEKNPPVDFSQIQGVGRRPLGQSSNDQVEIVGDGVGWGSAGNGLDFTGY